MVGPGGHLHDITPGAHVEHAVAVISRGSYGAVQPYPDGVVSPRGHLDDVAPAIHVELAQVVQARSDHRAVHFHPE